MKTYSDAEINSLIEELQKELPAILKAEAAANAEELAKGEAGGHHTPVVKDVGGGTAVSTGSKMADVTAGANGGTQKGATIAAGKEKGGKDQPKPVAGYLVKEESSVEGSSSSSSSSEGSSFAKADDGPPPKSDSADDEGGPDSDNSTPAASASAPPSASPDAPPADPASASPAGPPTADPAADPAMAGGDQGGGDQLGQLKQAYGALPDQELQMHFEALKDAVMSRMGGDQMGGSPVAAPDASMGSAPTGGPAMPDMAPPADASASPAGAPPQVAPPAQKAMPSMGGPMNKVAPAPGIIAKDELSKAQSEKIANLEKTLEGVTSLLETILTKPVQKSVTSMTEFMAKSNLETAAPAKLSKVELMKKVSDKARQPDLKKSDRDVINRYVLSGEGLADLEKLLAS